jgi:hypothetical protein
MHKRVRLTTYLAIVTLLSVAHCRALAPKFALLVSAHDVKGDDNNYDSEWWYDLILQYKLLKEDGFEESHIYVLYGGAHDFPSHHLEYNSLVQFGHPITNSIATVHNLEKAVNAINRSMDQPGFLYVWWMSHGITDIKSTVCRSALDLGNGEVIYSTDLQHYIDVVKNAEKRLLVIEACHSGELVSQFKDPRTLMLTSASCEEESYIGRHSCDRLPHAEVNYAEMDALYQHDLCGAPAYSDTTPDGRISVAEIFAYETIHVCQSSPELSDRGRLAESTFLADDRP